MHPATSPALLSSWDQHGPHACEGDGCIFSSSSSSSDFSVSPLWRLWEGTGFLRCSTQGVIFTVLFLSEMSSLKVHVAILKRLYCYYSSKRVGGRLSLCYLSWARCNMCDTLYANKFASVCTIKSSGALPANCWGPPKDDSDPCWKYSDQSPSKQFRKNPTSNKAISVCATRDQTAAYPAAWHTSLLNLSSAAVKNSYHYGMKCTGRFHLPFLKCC